jgi:hypothetical protein
MRLKVLIRLLFPNARGQAQARRTTEADRKNVWRTPKPGNGEARRLLPAPISVRRLVAMPHMLEMNDAKIWTNNQR